MIEPTESESLFELDRFCRAMNLIFEEYEKVRTGVWPADDNPLHNAPHTIDAVLNDSPKLGIQSQRSGLSRSSGRLSRQVLATGGACGQCLW